MTNSSNNYRNDIQVLRGYAVLIVVLYHARLNIFAAGYLGVDIFFVISGFLITGMVASQIKKATFSFSDFYFRRAKRLLPAAYSTFFVTALLSSWLLTSIEFEQLMKQLWGAVTFTSNIVLWRQGTYFGGEAELKPLLHTWSLAIEEQYYLILPLLLYIIPFKYWTRGVIIALVGSAVLCYFMMNWRPDAAFYLLPTRGWELAIGSLAALTKSNKTTQLWTRRLFWPSLALLIVLPTYPISNKAPGADTLIACLATMIVIRTCHPILQHGRIVNIFSNIGNWSYSLYLVHWPIFSLVSNMWVNDIPVYIKLGMLLISFTLGFLQYKYIEKPVHLSSIKFSWIRVLTISSASIVLMLTPYVFYRGCVSCDKYSYLRRGNSGLSPSCASRDKLLINSECQTSKEAKTLVWGDSYAMHLVDGLKDQAELGGLIQATKYVCGPILDVAPISQALGGTQNEKWAKECIAFNDSVFEYLKSNSHITTVVLSTLIKNYTSPNVFHTFVRSEDHSFFTSKSSDIALGALVRTIALIRAAGKRVVLIAPPPALDWDAGRCVERQFRELPTFGSNENCIIDYSEYIYMRSNVLKFLNSLKAEASVNIIYFDDVLRVNKGFTPILNNELLYISNGHLSRRGSEILAAKLHLGKLVEEYAK